MKPTYHLPPNFSTPPPPAGPFRLGTVIREFDRKEQMRPLTRGDDHVQISPSEIYNDHKGGFEATRSRLMSGELGIWAKFLGLDGIGAEASLSAERSTNDVYKFESLDTEYFYPSSNYIAQCLASADVGDYLKGTAYKKALFIVTGLKVAKGVSVRLERSTKVKGTLDLGLNNPGGSNIEVGPRITGQYENSPIEAFSESSNIVVGIQCVKIRHKVGWLGGQSGPHASLYTEGARFVADDDMDRRSVVEDFVIIDQEEDDFPNAILEKDAGQFGGSNEAWMVPR